MPRPKGSKNKATILKEKGTLKLDKRTDHEVLEDIKHRFDVYYSMINASAEGIITAVIVSGSAGVGKSYTAEWALERVKGRDENFRYIIVRGAISAIGLYELAYKYRQPRDVLVLDDADRIFDDEDGLNLMKGLLDTSINRKVSWMTDHPRFKGDGALPQEFSFQGAMIFLTNKNFQAQLDLGKGRYLEHMEALMSRSMYLDLRMHTRREVSIWAEHLVLKNKILQSLGLSSHDEQRIMEWLKTHRDELRELSIRTAIKLGKLCKMNPRGWELTAKVLLLRGS